MAFYSSRVDNEGNEIERRLSGRSRKSSGSSGGQILLSASSRTSESQSGRVRYVNPAAFIESAEFSDSSVNEGETNMEPDPNNANIVPPLDIQSNEGANSHRNCYTFSYRNNVEPATVIDPQLAYNTWLSAKRRVKSGEEALRKEALKEKAALEAERKRLAEAEYQKWLKKKEASQQAQSMKLARNAGLNGSQSSLTEKESTTQRYLRELALKDKREAWERKKRLENEKKRMEKQLEEERKRKNEEQRRIQAEEAWKKWKATAASKPKPVPLNQGFYTLRGTVSSIYVNPNEWQS